jgi:asparagine synthase (glutamine-hydrolysing)
MAKALEEWGLEALHRLDGMYGVVWWDGKVLRAARDVFGEVPLYYSPKTGWTGSEEKILRAAGIDDPVLLKPGHYVELSPDGASEPVRFDEIKKKVTVTSKGEGKTIRKLLRQGSIKKTISDVPVCCLLSGGIDSSFILRSVKEIIPNVVAYTAIFNEKSTDLKRTREVAEYLGVKLVEVPVPMPTREDLAEVVRIIEIPHKAQVEIGWACLNLAKQIRKDGFKVTFSGEGADEMFGSYGFSYHAIKEGRDWGDYRKELFHTQHRKNFLRCNKIFMSQGIECRLPFLHKPLVEYVTSLSLDVTGKDKQPLKDAARDLLPASVVDRPKVAFQDGLGLKKAIASAIGNPKAFYTERHKIEYPAPTTNRKGMFF